MRLLRCFDIDRLLRKGGQLFIGFLFFFKLEDWVASLGEPRRKRKSKL
jgi:hypothetical protein